MTSFRGHHSNPGFNVHFYNATAMGCVFDVHEHETVGRCLLV
jgi:hypothetical protein